VSARSYYPSGFVYNTLNFLAVDTQYILGAVKPYQVFIIIMYGVFMSKFIDFLTDVVSNPATMAALIKDPEKVMSDAGLTDEEKEVMRTRDKKKLEEYCSKYYTKEQLPKIYNDWWLEQK
jgi:hypothetical protein